MPAALICGSRQGGWNERSESKDRCRIAGAARIDNNSDEIVKAARKLGIAVVHIRHPVDLLVGIGGKFYPVELKSKGGKYTQDQLDFKALCEAKHLPFLTWYSAQDMLDQLGARG